MSIAEKLPPADPSTKKIFEKSWLKDFLNLLTGSREEKLKSLKVHLKKLSKDQCFEIAFAWNDIWARDKQLPPPGDWSTWIIRAGRGFGKTRCGAGWVHSRAQAFPGRWMALIARTPADARDYMIEGPGGLLRNTHPRERPSYEVSKRRVSWPNGSWATIYSDEEPDQCRGFSGDTAWLDEFAKFSNAEETWDNLSFGMREVSNDRPRSLITTTPRPIPILSRIEKLPTTKVVIGSSYENRENLDPRWFSDVLSRYEGTRLGRQEIAAEILEDIPGALWTRAMLEAALVKIEGDIEVRKGFVSSVSDGSIIPSGNATIGVWTGGVG